MATGIPLPGSMIDTLMSGLDTGSQLYSRAVQPIIERQRMAQQQNQFMQSLAIQQAEQARQNKLLPFMEQQYTDQHTAAANEAALKSIYLNMMKKAMAGNAAATPGAPPVPPGQPPSVTGSAPPAAGNVLNSSAGLPGSTGQVPGAALAPAASPTAQVAVPSDIQELRPGNPQLRGLDQYAGIGPFPKPEVHFANNMVITTYPSGRMTAQPMGGQTPGESTVSAKEASKIRDAATELVNSANLVQQGYDLLDKNPNLTGIGSGFSAALNVSNNPKLGEFNTVAGKLQASLGKYASQRGGIQAVKWAGSVKPSVWRPQDFNYGMFDATNQSLRNEYDTLNQQYKAATGGKDLPVPLPTMKSTRGTLGTGSNGQKVTKVWKLVNGQLV